MFFFPRRGRRGLAAALVLGLTTLALGAVPPSQADVTTVSIDNLRTGWDSHEPGLAPSAVSAADFGQLFATKLDGQIYAQPVVAKSTLLAVTEKNKAYGLDPVTGKIRWTRGVGPAWPASAIGCGDLVPSIGITATPVVDPATGTAYFTAKVNDGKNVANPHWYLHAVDITNGRERAGFPTTIAGRPGNDPSNAFNPKTAMQRPGLLLLGGVVYSAFASHCDKQPYVGYVVGVDAKTGKQTAMWAAETKSSKAGAGIWQSGGGLVADGPNRIILATGNGVSPSPSKGTSPPSTLAESVVRLQVKADRSLVAADFFSPVNNTNLDTDDTDLGAGGPMAIPDGFGTAAHPHLLVQVGKDGRVFLLDRDHLGGVGQRAGKKDDVLQVGGPYKGVWGHPAFWGGSGGYVYLVTSRGPLSAFKVGVSGSGLPALTRTGTSTGNLGYTSGSPVVTSDATRPGSALVWVVYSKGSNGAGGQLRAYDAVPTRGKLNLRYSAPIGTAGKFAVPATDAGRVYTGNRSGVVYGFGRPTTSALTGTPTDFGLLPLKRTSSKQVTVTAKRALKLTAIKTTAPFKVAKVKLPKSLKAGQSLTLAVSFTPTTAESLSEALSFVTTTGTFAFDLHGTGTKDGLISDPSTLDFGVVPTTGKVTLAVSITNSGSTSTTITGATGPRAPFSAGPLPATGATLAPGASVSVPVTFAPTAAGRPASALVVRSSTGTVSVPLSGSAVVGAPRLTLTPATLDFGQVRIGRTASKTFDISNSGNLLLTLSKAAPPTDPFTVPDPVSEGQQIEPGDVIHQSVSFTPTAVGAFSGTYQITGADGTGAHTVTVRGTGAEGPSIAVPAPADGGWQANGAATKPGKTTVLTPALTQKAGDVVSLKPVTGARLSATFTATLGGGTGGDGLTFALLDAGTAGPTSLGGPAGALAFGSLPGVAVTLDTHQDPGDRSDNFVGIATSTRGGKLAYVATAAAPTSLRAGPHTVRVTTTATTVTVRLDGGLPLTATVPVPARARLAFTAATGERTDVHTVRDVTLTQQPPSGPVVGLAGMCVDVRGGKKTNGTPVQLHACNDTDAETWSAVADGTLQSLGKCLDVKGGKTTSGTKVQLWRCNGTAAQTWAAQANGSLRNTKAANRCLDIPHGKPKSRVVLQIHGCNGTPAQRWTLPR